VLAVPVYHGAMPGGLKNALDFIDAPHVGGKPIALIGIAGGDAEPGVTDTARVLRHIGAVGAVPDVVISRASEHWGPGETPANGEVAAAIERVATDLMALCALRADGKLPG
jgi:NAD(P)H-dependent FMN reductase